MKALTYLLILSFFISCSSQYERRLASVSSANGHCYDDLSLSNEFRADPYYQPFVMLGGAYKGECVDNRERRSIRILEHNDDNLLNAYSIKPKKNHLYFANFKHKNKYHLAEFEVGSVEDTYLVFEKFLEVSRKKFNKAKRNEMMRNVILSGHAQLRFRLKKGKFIKLYPQVLTTRMSKKVTRINDFAYAMFAVRPLSTSGQLFDPLGDGISKGYILSHNFMSTYDVALTYKDYVNGAKSSKTEVSQFKFERKHFDGNKALEKLLYHSHHDYMKRKPIFYHTWYNNCITSMYIGIDAGAKKQGSLQRLVGLGAGAIRPLKWRTGGKEWNPMSVLPNLRRRGIIKADNQSETINLNEEICQILKGQDYEDVRAFCKKS
jgi:hypothetical protein